MKARCKLHPRYIGRKPPSNGCFTCINIFANAHPDFKSGTLFPNKTLKEIRLMARNSAKNLVKALKNERTN